MIYQRMDPIFTILCENSDVQFWPGLDPGKLKGDQIGGEGGIFLHKGNPIGNLIKPIWVFLNSQYYDL